MRTTPTPPTLPAGAWLTLFLVLSFASPAPAADDWKYDIVYLKNGRSMRGLVVERNDREVVFRAVVRKPGARTIVFHHVLGRAEVESLELLEDRERKVLETRLNALDRTGKGEELSTAQLEIKPITWGKDGKGWRHQAVLFTLESNAPEDTFRRAAYHLEQIYTAYTSFLPPRHESAEPTTVLLAVSQPDYQALLKARGRVLRNPAFYDERRNEVICGTELTRLSETLERTRQQIQQTLKDVKAKEAELAKVYGGKIPAALLKPLAEAKQEADKQLRRCDEAFQAETRQLFRTLYHEAFHAYLANFVYPSSEATVPLWLNEGLAQVFETAFVEAGELRVGHADKDRLARMQAALKKNEVLPLTELLRSGPKQFVVLHAGDEATSDRHYLAAWAVAFYLTFERKLLGTPAMDGYVKALRRGADPVTAFAELTGQRLTDFEKDFHGYLPRLRQDGTVTKAK
jgi:hypothetical protein